MIKVVFCFLYVCCCCCCFVVAVVVFVVVPFLFRQNSAEIVYYI